MRAARGVVTIACLVLAIGCASLSGETASLPTLSPTGTPGATPTPAPTGNPTPVATTHATPGPSMAGGPCAGGSVQMPDPPLAEPAYNLVEGEARLVSEVARLNGLDPASVTPNNYGLEEAEIWGPGIAWNVEKLQVGDASDPQMYFVDLYSGQVISYSAYKACWTELVAIGGPFDVVPPTPSFTAGPGLLGMVIGKPYVDAPIGPEFAGYNYRPPEAPPFDEETLTAMYGRVSPLISTANGLAYVEPESEFYCSQVDCHLVIRGKLPNSADYDEWWFDVDRDGSNGVLDRTDGAWPFQYSSVPHDAVQELLELVASDADATRRANEYTEFAFGN